MQVRGPFQAGSLGRRCPLFSVATGTKWGPNGDQTLGFSRRREPERMRVTLTFAVHETDRPLAHSRALERAMRAGLERPEVSACHRGRGVWIVEVAGYVKATPL